MIFYEKNGKDISLTTRHYGISRKTFYKWLKRFDSDFIRGLEDESRVPRRRRTRQYTPRQYERIVSLRQERIRYGKMKLLEIYRRQHTEIAFARMYSSHSSWSSRDFLNRLHILLDGKIENVQTDNGSEFHGHFETACQTFNLDHYWSRVKTPKDNAVNERFNRTLQDE